jgi:virginiamycin B lyase
MRKVTCVNGKVQHDEPLYRRPGAGRVRRGLLVAPAIAPPIAGPGTEPARHRVTISQFADLPVYYDYYGPSAVAAGPHHALWVTDTIDQDFGENAVVEVATSGKALNTFYYGGRTSEGSDLADLAEGPDGALWITDEYNEQILRMTTAGKFTSYQVGTSPWYIVGGPDNALWFTEGSAIARITTKGSISTYDVSGSPGTVASGPDKALWFTIPQSAMIGRITTRGKMTYYSKGISSGSYPYWIAAGPDGALWFTEYDGGRIGRISVAGKVTEYSRGITSGERPAGIAEGPDDAMWFTESECPASSCNYNSKIGRITTSGAIAEYDKFDTASGPTAIAQGADKNMWFTESDANEMGRVNL